MENARKRKLMPRWSLGVAVVIALFWAIWYLAKGSVPVMTGIKITENWRGANNWIIQFPFGISRWWDVLAGPVWSAIFIMIFVGKKYSIDEDEDSKTVDYILDLLSSVGAFVGTFVVIGLLCSGLAFLLLWLNIDSDLVLILTGSLVFGLGIAVVDFIFNDDYENSTSSRFFLIVASGFGFGIGLISGLLIGLLIGLVVAFLGSLLALFFRWLILRNFWRKIGIWLLARNAKVSKT